MIRPSKVRIIARFELVSAVRRPSYLVMTFGLPLFLGLITALPTVLQRQIVADEVTRTVHWGLVDTDDILSLDYGRLDLSTLEFLVLEDEEAARERIGAGDIEGYFVVPADYLDEGRVFSYQRTGRPPFDVGAATSARSLEHLLVQRLLLGEVAWSLAQRIQKPLDLEHFEIDDSGALREVEDRGLEIIARLLVPIVLAALLLMALMTTSGYLVQAIAVEKENKVVEVLLSSADPDEILTGKLFGLGAAGFLQFAAWSSLFIMGLTWMAGLLGELSVGIPWRALAVAPVFFIVGYFFVGSLMLATGSLGNSATESQKFTMVWGLLCLMPMLMLTVLMAEPHGVLAQVFTYIPFTAPLTIILRMALDPAGVPWWEVTGALAMLGLSTWLSIRLGARLFRVGLLITGSWPGFRSVWRQSRLR
ncbi:MAG: hypothetical protein DRJ42_10130 [Deltaproteobacteria bacterium]|nr:MAG: hypothetical protein DRJ42_10130 [Deltaproteobacteria bacterium]